ncbi:Anti-sigma-K factor rskA [Chitinophaga terrae (ex Kim and Jung 2007)]|uniref:Anti-sigma-K factor rskA n=1 Tax=Chitinophaga terrae (ex Kim and Jung 2007) TaxID=408074 RepID=A0A1H4C4W1_9BACT|nr:anti-sigma factor [Chitinophaga terrae (ex Kim and Jung 2007)]GEP92230.1 hypothetical protein CTE07_38750 [Chitinophaga terrae (ex Kim and Jung 2007)]SEA55495.1 Anti-sigma-K factor rskA [Chitinophaga terrae (ex Kim and Jung 2007)]
MDVQQYISSGILESYVFGMLPEEEQIEVELAALQYPDIRAAVRALQQDKERFVQLYSIAPPAGIKEKILAMIHEDEVPLGNNALPKELQFKPSLTEPQKQQSVKLPLSLPVNAKPKLPNKTATAKRTSDRNWKYATAAIIVILIGSVVLNFFFFNASNDYEGRYKELIATRERLDAEKAKKNEASLKSTDQERLLNDPAVSWTHIDGTGAYEGNSVRVGWNTKTKSLLLQAELMPLPPKGKQFHLWALVNNVYKDAGVFATGMTVTRNLQQMQEMDSISAYTISLQPVGVTRPPVEEEVCMTARVVQ